MSKLIPDTEGLGLTLHCTSSAPGEGGRRARVGVWGARKGGEGSSVCRVKVSSRPVRTVPHPGLVLLSLLTPGRCLLLGATWLGWAFSANSDPQPPLEHRTGPFPVSLRASPASKPCLHPQTLLCPCRPSKWRTPSLCLVGGKRFCCYVPPRVSLAWGPSHGRPGLKCCQVI